jgi:hypothetical protein
MSNYSTADLNAAIDAIIGEALGEGDKGMAAVAGVILNRARRDNVGLKAVVSNGQFNGYTSPGASVKASMADPQVRARASAIVNGVIDGTIDPGIGNADFFHTTAVSPSWSKSYDQVGQVGSHIFYASGKVPPTPPNPVNSTASLDWNGKPTQVNQSLASTLLAAQTNLPFSIKITSSTRTPEQNTAVGGASKSQHLSSNAVDISLVGLSDAQRTQLVAELSRAGATRMIAYSGDTGLHVDMADGYTPQKGYRTYAMFDRKAANMGNAPKWYTDGLTLGNAPIPATPSPDLVAQRQTSPLDAIAQNVASDPTAMLQGYVGKNSPLALTASAAQSSAPPSQAPWSAPNSWGDLAAQSPAVASNPATRTVTSVPISGATYNAPVPMGRNMRPTAQATIPVDKHALAESIRAMPQTKEFIDGLGFFEKTAANIAMTNDDFVIGKMQENLPPSVQFDPKTSTFTIADVNSKEVQDAVVQVPALADVLRGANYTSVPSKAALAARGASPALDAINRATGTAGWGAPTGNTLSAYASTSQASASPQTYGTPSAGNLLAGMGFDAFGNVVPQQNVAKPSPSYQQGMTGRGLPAPSFPADYNPTNALSVMQADAPAKAYAPPTPWGTLAAQSAGSKPVQPSSPQVGASNLSSSIIPAAPWATPLPAAARTLLAKPYSVSTQILAPTQAITPTGAITTVDMMRALSDPNYKPAAPLAPAPVAQEASPVLRQPAPVPAPVTWTTTSTLPAPTAPAKPSFKLGNPLDGGVLGLGGFGGGLMGKLFSSVFQSTPAGRIPGSATPQPGFAGYSNAPKVAPRGEFGQALGVGGLYNQGAIWGANGGGYGNSPGQVTTGLRSGERVYDPNTGEWGLKVGQPVTWTKSGGSSGGTSGTTGTFQGTSTKNSYTVGQTYKNGNGTYVAQADGTFKRV